MGVKHALKVIGAGLLAGLVAATVMILVMVVTRSTLGIATPAELIGDRVAPQLTIRQFFDLLRRFRGYDRLKQLGIGSSLAGMLVFGIIGGVVYALVIDRSRGSQPDRRWRFGISRAGTLLVVFLIGLAWIVSLVALWPVLGTNYFGLPPTSATFATAAGLLLDYAAYGATLALVYRLLTSREPLAQPAPVQGNLSGRRAFLTSGVALAAAVGSGGLLARLYRRASFDYDGLTYEGPEIQPITPNDEFYVVTKNVVDPSVARSLWRLEIRGMVERPRDYDFGALAALPAVDQETTLTCISNPIGGGLQSNAIWRGVPLRDLIEAAGPRAGVTEVVLTGVDGYVDTFAFGKAMEPTTMVVYEMNGEPLSDRHGFPARVIVPGLVGEKNMKWVTHIELVDHHVKGFYETQGWGPNFAVNTSSRFQGPSLRPAWKVGEPVGIRGTAFSGNRGISRVEVSVDDGETWQEAELISDGPPEAWRFWSLMWTPPQAGDYKLVVRATDLQGVVQTSTRKGIAPEAATGYHRLTANVVA